MQDIDAARVGGQISSDLTAALRTQAERKQALLLTCRILNVFQYAPGLSGDRAIPRIDFANFIESFSGQNNLIFTRDSPAA